MGNEQNDDAWNNYAEELEREAEKQARRDADEDARDLCERTKEELRKLARDGEGE